MEAAGKRYIEHPSRSDEIMIWNIADIHWLSKACAEDEVRADIQEIADDPNAFFLGGGDYCDFIGYTDKRFDPDSVAPWVSVKDLGKLGEVGMRQIRDLFWPIRHKCLGLLLGNHEKKYQLKKEQDHLHAWLCTELGVPNLEYSALFDAVCVRNPKAKGPRLLAKSPPTGFSRVGWRIFAHHGAGYAQTPGGKLNRLIQFMFSFDADIYFCGHVHDKVGRREPSLGGDPACTRLRAHEKLGVISGSYLKTYAQGVTTYGEQRGYRPTALGAAWVRLIPATGKAKAEI